MIDCGSLEFAWARLCARHGARPDDELWRRIETLRDFSTLVATVHASVLAAWIPGIGPEADVHAIERAGRRRWRELVVEVAGWMPPAWCNAVLWCATLADLPVLLHLVRGGARFPWIEDDPAYREFARPDSGDSRSATAALAAAAADGPERLIDAWQGVWLRRVPDGAATLPPLADLLATLTTHARAFAGSTPAVGRQERGDLQKRLITLFHRSPGDPAAVFVHIALRALEYERLRGELLRRRAFPSRALAA